MPRAFSLVRVSTPRQAGPDRYGPTIQDEKNREFIAAHGWAFAGTFADVITGKSEYRKSFEDLLEVARPGDIAVFFNQRRLARDVPLSYYWLDVLTRAGLELWTVEAGQRVKRGLEFGMRAVISEHDHEQITQQLYDGRMRRAGDGKPPTGVQAQGYRVSRPGAAPEIDPERAAVVQRLFELRVNRLAGRLMPYNEVARRLNDAGTVGARGKPWTAQTVRQVIENPIYKGEHVYAREGSRRRTRTTAPVVTQVPALVDLETWQLAQPPSQSKRINRKGLLTGFIRCGVCGANMSLYSPTARSTVYYRCSGTACRLHVRAKPLEDGVDLLVRQGIRDYTFTPPESEDHGAELERLEEEDARWLEAYRARAVTAAELAAERKAIQKRREALRPAPVRAGVGYLEELQREAGTRPLRELMQLAEVLIIATRDSYEVTVFAGRP